MRDIGWLAWIRCVATGAALCLLIGGEASAALDGATRTTIRSAVFEVVVPKPTGDSLTYEKPLPLELIPFRERNDKYLPVGTAFAIGDGRYITAAHVLRIGQRTQFDPRALRDANAKVYQIDEILKYSLAEDFVVFTLKDDPKGAALAIGAKPAVNDAVYAIGNALGEGVVTRDGVFTSETPEDQDGRWSWLRFSAPASPGNSGGPLLDEHGGVVGIVIGKSPNENLNFALPIDLAMKAPEGSATIDTRTTYRIGLFNATETAVFKDEVPLPKTFAELSDAVATKSEQFQQRQLSNLLAHNAAILFPNGPGSEDLLETGQSRISSVPSLIMRKSDGNWDAAGPGNVQNSVLPHNGSVALGISEDRLTVLLHAQRPDDTAAAAFYADSKAYGDMLMKAVPLNRTVGSENVRITSLGKARTDTIFVDRYERKWQLRTWVMEFADQVIISLAVPVPDGYAAMVRQVPTAAAAMVTAELEAMADFVSVLYTGRFQQWRDFLAQPSLLPAVFSTITVAIDYDHSFQYRSKRIAFSFTPELQAITKESAMSLRLGYFRDGDKVVWDVRRVSVIEDAHAKTQCEIVRIIRPSDDMRDAIKGDWIKIVHRLHPFTDLPYEESGNTLIRSVYGPSDATDANGPAILYTANYLVEGRKDEATMKAKLAAVMKELKVFEN